MQVTNFIRNFYHFRIKVFFSMDKKDFKIQYDYFLLRFLFWKNKIQLRNRVMSEPIKICFFASHSQRTRPPHTLSRCRRRSAAKCNTWPSLLSPTWRRRRRRRRRRRWRCRHRRRRWRKTAPRRLQRRPQRQRRHLPKTSPTHTTKRVEHPNSVRDTVSTIKLISTKFNSSIDFM